MCACEGGQLHLVINKGQCSSKREWLLEKCRDVELCVNWDRQRAGVGGKYSLA
jgi:hypothetical protein